MLTGKELGAAIATAIDLKIASGAISSKVEVAQAFGVKPPSIHDWIKRGTIGKEKLPLLWSYFSDVVGPDHWGMAEAVIRRPKDILILATEAENLGDKFRGINQSEFAKNFKVPGGPSMISQHIKGLSPISLEAALAYSKGFGCPLEEISPRLAAKHSAALAELAALGNTDPAAQAVIEQSEAAPAEGYVRLQHLSPRPTMGMGAVLDEPVRVVRHLDVLETWLMEEVGSSNYTKVKVLTAVGRSMMPTINDKDLVFIDVTHRTVDAPGIYVIDVAGRLLLKKAMIKANGTLVLRSDNATEYPDEETYDLGTYADEITVCGKVLAWWTLRKG